MKDPLVIIFFVPVIGNILLGLYWVDYHLECNKVSQAFSKETLTGIQVLGIMFINFILTVLLFGLIL